MVGLGVMGRNLLLNLAEHGFSVAGYDRKTDKVEALLAAAGGWKVPASTAMKTFIAGLQKPRMVMLLVPAGEAVDEVIDTLLLQLEPGDLVIDGGNSHFKDTDRRAVTLAAKGIQFLGVGVSGGEAGARRGPSIMPGGPPEAYARVQPLFEAIAAKVKGDSCVAWLGPGSAGHYVKMVHNGIEYAMMQLIAESYDLMKRGFALNNDEISEVYQAWNRGKLGGYLVEISGRIFQQVDPVAGGRLIDWIRGEARQNGTGLWTSQSAMELQVPTPTIDLAVAMRDLSVLTRERQQASLIYQRATPRFEVDRDILIKQLGQALWTGILVCYAQGFALLAAASVKYGYQLDLAAVARIWRGGCIIRTAMLEAIWPAFQVQKNLPNLLLDAHLGSQLTEAQESLREVVCQAAAAGLPAAGLMVSLGYLDAYRSAWMPDNLIQAQRDCFGAHTYERTDVSGTFHTAWEKSQVPLY